MPMRRSVLTMSPGTRRPASISSARAASSGARLRTAMSSRAASLSAGLRSAAWSTSLRADRTFVVAMNASKRCAGRHGTALAGKLVRKPAFPNDGRDARNGYGCNTGDGRPIKLSCGKLNARWRRITAGSSFGGAEESGLLFRRQVNDLAPVVHRLEGVDVLLRTLPAERNFQSHEICDVTDKGRAIECFGVPDRCTRLQFLDVGEYPLCVRLIQVDTVIGSQVLRIKIAVACAGLGRHQRQMTDHISQRVSRGGKTCDFDFPFACLSIPDESVSPARRRSGSEIDVVRSLC